MLKLTVDKFKEVFTNNGGRIDGEVIEKVMRDKPGQQLFAQLLQQTEVRHFMVNLIEKKIYEGSLYTSDGQLLFGYLNFPVVSYENYDLQMR
jgi:hypothetical protein